VAPVVRITMVQIAYPVRNVSMVPAALAMLERVCVLAKQDGVALFAMSPFALNLAKMEVSARVPTPALAHQVGLDLIALNLFALLLAKMEETAQVPTLAHAP